MFWIIISITWLVVGMLTFFAMAIAEMRGQEYDKYYFEGTFSVFLLMTFMGYISPIIAAIAWIATSERISFTRIIYNIANIGLKDKKLKGEEHE